MAWHAIHDSVDESKSLAALSDFSERLYWRILAKSDAWGRMRAETHRVKARCVPLISRATEKKIGAALTELSEVGRIFLYAAEEGDYLQILDHDKHQPSEFIRKRSTSKHPPPAFPEVSGKVRESPEVSGKVPKKYAIERERDREVDKPLTVPTLRDIA